ncbi:MAG: cytochrome d terminal oxidase subunit 1 [Ferrovum sp. 37-45-19]|jgi:cytochrome d ubiquinol oxidase subunit I|uniref:cytochrome ubiquinol oxidase subunit I n=1 Tax=Ferrovum sp. JA12 TaxID=1356299 RepID=UPI00070273B5|nr:cytochrome ubiquinol oxidase subunit I [Ferrovum sp. JA12]OYV78846.1 MAG: cytochrome d terminal oxidase subunit 1 [Ferrovum sp. 21-44-67]OYV93503.1 MAG: cytochrome d terminal oxidase subunit 1 [Ferrovum sp. 37-45-19]OZB33112.1 MAG: cytochrome d terminal oxidase subunit 1 [Ferrovum sp. 34-44-207]HQT82198.1 cytochrome ubiquinol oxidase subunit I [Ferrovaceae bacterium]KRH79931.1 cytochrome bd ubiquinol oxidase subunit 1 [Ferrovum sp. JA12]
MISDELVNLSRMQFAITALYHFLFVPLTIGMVWILVVMESVYVMTGKTIYKDMTRFWGKLFGINFALGVTTGITMEFQFGTNWAYYSHYVGDVFGAPLAIEGLMAFFLESTFIGLFFFAWDRLSKPKHLMVTLLMAIGTNLSAMWILIANGWMQNPVGAEFNYTTMRMELTDFSAMLFNPDAQAKFVHTVSAGYVTASTFVLAISAWYLLKGRNVEFAKRSFRIAAAFGLASALSVIVLGDESGYTVGEAQQTKMAAIEAMWETEPAPAPFNLVAMPNEKLQKNDWSIQVPWLMGLIGTRSVSKQIPGIHDIKEKNRLRVISGIEAVKALEIIRSHPEDARAKQIFETHKKDLGFGLLLKQYTNDFDHVSSEQIEQAVNSTVPKVAPMFWGFRIMVAIGFLLLSLFVISFWASLKTRCEKMPWLLKWAFLMFPMPWVACEFGWFVAEYGRQPWTIYGVLPTHLSVSTLSPASLYGSIGGFVGFYTLLLIVEVYLMIKFARQGPASLGTGRYEGESALAPSRA